MKDYETHSKLMSHWSNYSTDMTNEEFSTWLGELANLHAEYND